MFQPSTSIFKGVHTCSECHTALVWLHPTMSCTNAGTGPQSSKRHLSTSTPLHFVMCTHNVTAVVWRLSRDFEREEQTPALTPPHTKWPWLMDTAPHHAASTRLAICDGSSLWACPSVGTCTPSKLQSSCLTRRQGGWQWDAMSSHHTTLCLPTFIFK